MENKKKEEARVLQRNMGPFIYKPLDIRISASQLYPFVNLFLLFVYKL